MNCARFEQELARLLAGESADRDALAAHAASCDACAGSRELVDWASLPATERFEDAVRSEADWARFDVRLRDRLSSEGDRASRSRRRGVWAAVAAVGVIALLSGWILRNPSPPAAPTATVEAIAEPDDPEDVLDRWASGGSAEVPGPTLVAPAAGWSVPEAEDLDAEERDELLDWLRDEAARLEGGQA